MPVIKRSLFWKLGLLILIGTALVQLSVLSVNHRRMSRVMLADQQRHFSALSASCAQEINHLFFAAQRAVDETAALFEAVPRTREQAHTLLNRMLAANPSLYGAAVALAPDQDADAAGFRILYSWRDGSGLSCLERQAPDQDYQSDWFYLPYHLQRPVWTDPYFDRDVRTHMVTYAAPVVADGRVVAVITSDLTLEHIRGLLSGLELGRRGDPLLISQFGRLIIHPEPRWIGKETLYSLAESATDDKDRQDLLRISQAMVQESSGRLRYERPLAGDPAWLIFDTVACTGWRVGFVLSEKAILAPIHALNRRTAAIAAIGILLLLVPALLVSLTISRPLHRLCEAAEQLAGGNFDAPLPPVKGRDEIGRLIAGFDSMRVDLRRYIHNLAATTAEKEKIASELSIAREIQHSILPKLFPPFPQRPGLDLYALLESAKEVGGDLYDFALLDDRRLYLCIGDVSGKGVPASLFMAVGKTLLKSTIQTIQDPAKALAHVNNELVEGNDTCMFITAFCAILDLDSHEMICANAGHNPPMILRDNRATILDIPCAAPLAAMADTAYVNQVVTLDPGSKFLLYTDGVTEAMNAHGALFGESRLKAHLEQDTSRTAERCIQTLVRSVRDFAGSAEQSDDITLMCVSYCPNEATCDPSRPTASLVLTNHREEFARMVTWLEGLRTQLGWPEALFTQLNLILEEWVVNVVTHAFRDDLVHEIELRLWQTDGTIRIECRDDGVPFDPTKHAGVDLSAPIEERPIGGLGIHFIRQSTDEFAYERRDGFNVVTMVRKRDG